MIDLELCSRFWHRIYHIQRRSIYSIYEIEKLVKDIERIKHLCPEPERLKAILDDCYQEPLELLKRIELISRFRSVFHKPLKQMSENPLNADKYNRLIKNNISSKVNY